ncbi:hypothetical protein ACIBEJ_34575 [Nonomuraea sp. NPDC050790]|uniref:hypothetical protein n=1 Tax=Nonomuraea sp. NPDC050790 TaxID=3364371 RepID=UPI00379A4029
MVPIAEHFDDPEIEAVLIQKVLSAIEVTLARHEAVASAQESSEFLQRRNQELVAQLELAYTTMARMSRNRTEERDFVDDSTTPIEIRHAMRSRASRAQRVRKVIGGRERVFMVPARGDQYDPREARDLWHFLRDRYGEGQS